MRELIITFVILIVIFSCMGFCLIQMSNEYNSEKEKAFKANCEFYHGTVEKDSYGTLHCV